MTEYEIADLALSNAEAIRSQSALIQDQTSLLIDRINLFYTFIFSYLIVAYIVGATLTKVQLVALNLLFLCVMALNRIAYVHEFLIRQGFRNELLQLQDAAPLPEGGLTIALTISIIMILVSLFFMWSVRHQKN